MSETTKVYVPDDDDVWREAEVLQLIDDSHIVVHVKPLSGGALPGSDRGQEEIDLSGIAALLRETSGETDPDGVVSLPLVNDDAGAKGVDVMCTLNYLHEPAILFNLRQVRGRTRTGGRRGRGWGRRGDGRRVGVGLW